MFLKRPTGDKAKVRRKLEDETEESDDAAAAASSLKLETKKLKLTANVVTATSRKEATEDSLSMPKSHETKSAMDIGGDKQKSTVVLETETPTDQDHRAILERNAAIGAQLLSGDLETGVYRGIGAYKPIINRREGALSAAKYTGAYGPIRGTLHSRLTMRIDYQPDICKDYKETGYCGFGDTCKFLHDRSDYKSGWQIEKEWEEEQRRKQEALRRKLEKSLGRAAGEGDEGSGGSDSDSDDSDEEKRLPFACHLCRSKWTKASRPVVTQCSHFFCEKCAFSHYAKSAKCAICCQPTLGIFNSGEMKLKKVIEANEAELAAGD